MPEPENPQLQEMRLRLREAVRPECDCSESENLIRLFAKLALQGGDFTQLKRQLVGIAGDCTGSSEREKQSCGLPPTVCNHPNGGLWLVRQCVDMCQRMPGYSK